MSIDLGFGEECESAWLVNRYFPSKLGGKPAWLDLERLPKPEEIKCSNCGLPKTFLCQIYATFDSADTFHRTVFVFYCRSPECQKPNDNSNISVFRSQLPLRNSFYSTDPPNESGNPLPAIATKENLCECCGCLGPFACAACKKVHYCSKEHQRKHYRYHKAYCQAADKSQMPHPPCPKDLVTFPEYEIAIENYEYNLADLDFDEEENEVEDVQMEDKIDAAKESEKEKEQLAIFEQMKLSGQAGTLADVSETELTKYAGAESSAPVDKYFKRFKKAIAIEPTQLIRYEQNGQPLWIANPDETVKAQLEQMPKCENCGADRHFEFQIMPQVLNNLKDTNVDWGVLAIYTCKESCSSVAPDRKYLKEYAVKQDILPDNLKGA